MGGSVDGLGSWVFGMGHGWSASLQHGFVHWLLEQSCRPLWDGKMVSTGMLSFDSCCSDCERGDRVPWVYAQM